MKRIDEIGDIAKAFNRMTHKLKRILKSGKEPTENISHGPRIPLKRIRMAKIAQGS